MNRMLVPLLATSNVVLLVAVVVLARRPGPSTAVQMKQAPVATAASPAPHPPSSPAPRAVQPPVVETPPVSLAGVLAEKSALPDKEFRKKLSDACVTYRNASPEEISGAIRQLPAGRDFLGAFNTLSFYHFQNAKRSPVEFYQELLSEKAFPLDWIQSAVTNGLSIVGGREPARALSETFQHREFFTSDAGTASVLGHVLRNQMQAGAGNLSESVAFVTSLPPKLAEKVADGPYFWNLVVGAGDVAGTLGRFRANAVPLNNPAMTQLGESISNAHGFDKGQEIIRDQAGNNTAVMNGFVDQWMERDPNIVLSAMPRIDASLHDDIISRNLRKISAWDPEAAALWANQIKDPARKAQALEELGR